MNYDHTYLSLLIELGYRNENDPLTYQVARTAIGVRLHVDDRHGSCALGAAAETKVGTLADFLDEYTVMPTRTNFCQCVPRDPVMRGLAGVAEPVQRRIAWVARARYERVNGNDPDQAAYAYMTVGADSGDARLDAEAAAEVEHLIDVLETTASHPDGLSLMARILREGETFLLDARSGARRFGSGRSGPFHGYDEYLEVNYVHYDPAPAGSTDAQVVAHHQAQPRLWVLLSADDVNKSSRPWSLVNALADNHAVLPDGRVLTTLPTAGVARHRMECDRVLGFNDGYQAHEVANVISIVQLGIPLADAMTALYAARL